MKTQPFPSLESWISIVFTALVAGCGSAPKPPPVYFPISTPQRPPPPNGATWVPDQFSTYSIGRYVDPSDPAMMHEAHNVYRREQTGRWNLAPPNPFLLSDSPISERDTTMLHDALTAELNRQRAISQTLIEQARILNQRLRELNAHSQEFHDTLQQSSRLRNEMLVVSNRLNSVETALRNLPRASSRTP